MVTVPEGHTVDEPSIKAIIDAAVTQFTGIDIVESATSPWFEYTTGMINADKTAAIINLQMKGDSVQLTDAQRKELTDVASQVQAKLPAGSHVYMGGQAFSIQIPTLSVTEVAGVVVAAVVLAVTLGSALAAGLPLVTALIGVGITMAIITLAANLMDVNSTTPILAVMLGLAVGIDYALFILSRHRDQLRDGMAVEESVRRAVATAGSAVVFAGATVVIALLGLGLAGIPFLTTMGAFAAAGVALAVVIALTMLPAFMGVLGERMRPRFARGTVSRSHTQSLGVDHGAKRRGFNLFRWWVEVVLRRPLVVIVAVIVAMGALAIPATHLAMSLPNSGQNPSTAADRIAFDHIEQEFGAGYNAPIIVTADIINSTDPLGVIAGLRKDIEALPGVKLVAMAVPNQNADTAMVQVIPTSGPSDAATSDLVVRLRDQHDAWESTYHVDTAVTGLTVIQLDVSQQISGAMVPFGAFVVGLSLVLLAMVFRSVWVPIKATLGYVLSVGTAMGMTQLVFNRGIARQVVNLEKPDPVISFLPILLMGILFGLAMDYEVFLVSRIREEYVHGKSARRAIVDGYVASGKVVVAAAVIMFSVFAFFVPEGIGAIKQIAFSLAVGVAADAFLIRLTLVPAVLGLLGDRAWRLPGWLDRVLPSFDVEGESLTRMKRYEQWPTSSHVETLHAEDLAVEGALRPLTMHLDPGQVGAVCGPLTLRSAVLLALAGRYPIIGGIARVAGFLLKEQAGRVRQNTSFTDADLSPDAVAELRAARRARRRLTVVNNADHLDEAAAVELAALISETRAGGNSGVLLGMSDIHAATRWGADLVVTFPDVPTNGGVPHSRQEVSR